MVISSAGICLVHSSWTSDRGSAAAHLPTLTSSATCCLLGKRDSWLADFVAFLVFFERLKRSTLECLALSLAVYQSKAKQRPYYIWVIILPREMFSGKNTFRKWKKWWEPLQDSISLFSRLVPTQRPRNWLSYAGLPFKHLKVGGRPAVLSEVAYAARSSTLILAGLCALPWMETNTSQTCGLCARATDSLWPFMPDFHIAFCVKTIITLGRFGKVKATCLMHFWIQFGELQQAPCNFSQNPHYNWYLWHFVTLDSWYSSFQSMDVHHCPSPSVD